MGQMQIDINCDMGESFGNYRAGDDENIFPYITSCNIACGFHAGDPWHMERTIALALQHQVTIGAHPSYPDLNGFGRRRMQVKKEELKSIIKYQLAALKGMVESQGGKMAYVKPHGALYNTAVDDAAECATIIEAIREIDPDLYFMGLAHSVMEDVAIAHDQPFIREAFADRTYTAEGKLLSRNRPNAVITDAEQAATQVLSMVREGQVRSDSGASIALSPQSICIHGDNPVAIPILEAIDRALAAHAIVKTSFA